MRVSQQGMSLLSLLLGLMITAIISVGVGKWLFHGFQGYQQGQDRIMAQLPWRFAQLRLSKEIQHAVPNSLVIAKDGASLSFIPIAFAGQYQNDGLLNISALTVNWLASPLQFQSFPNQCVRVVISPEKLVDLLRDGRSMAVSNVTSKQVVFSRSISFLMPSDVRRFYGYQHQVVWRIKGSELWREVLDLSGEMLRADRMGSGLKDPSSFFVSSIGMTDAALVSWRWSWAGRHHQGNGHYSVRVLNEA
jgi:MSHA biogenesis protein MshO